MTINYDAGKTTVTDFVTITYVLVEIYNPGFIRDWPITLVCQAGIQMTDIGIGRLAAGCPNLNHLNLHW